MEIRLTRRVLLLLILFAAVPAHAQVPVWSAGKDAQGRLLVPDGMGHSIPFDQIRAGVKAPGGWQPSCPGASDKANGCPVCNQVIYGSVQDGYAAQSGKDADLLHVNTNSNVENLLVKDSIFQNAWTCNGGAWSRGGLSCADKETSKAHVDLIQTIGAPENGGWVVLQGSKFINGDQNTAIIESADKTRGRYDSATKTGQCADPAGAGGFVWQDVEIGNSKEFAADCLARGGPASCGSGNQIAMGSTTGSFGDVWFIGVRNTSGLKIRAGAGVPKIIVIGGSGGRNGWPGPLGPGPVAGDGTCNGKVAGNYGEKAAVTDVYCYPSIEAALAAGHKRPPFLQLSSVGWAGVWPVPPLPKPTPAPAPAPVPAPQPAPRPEPPVVEPPAPKPAPAPVPEPTPVPPVVEPAPAPPLEPAPPMTPVMTIDQVRRIVAEALEAAIRSLKGDK